MSADLSYWREKWLELKPQYDQFALFVTGEFRSSLKKAGLYAEVSHRTKTVASFLKKIIRKQMADPVYEMHDKVGVRAIVPFLSNLPKVDKIIRCRFEIKHFDNKTASLGEDRFAYQSWHYDVILKEPIPTNAQSFRNFWCEIQLRTGSQHLWADMAHRLVYKSEQPIPGDYVRRVHLLNALLELADRQFEDIREDILRIPESWSLQVLSGLEGLYYEFSSTQYDRELSLEVIDAIRPICSADPFQVLGQAEAWVSKNREIINQLVEQYSDYQERAIFLFQPEGLLLLDLLARDQFRLRQFWEKRFAGEELRQLATIFALPYD